MILTQRSQLNNPDRYETTLYWSPDSKSPYDEHKYHPPRPGFSSFLFCFACTCQDDSMTVSDGTFFFSFLSVSSLTLNACLCIVLWSAWLRVWVELSHTLAPSCRLLSPDWSCKLKPCLPLKKLVRRSFVESLIATVSTQKAIHSIAVFHRVFSTIPTFLKMPKTAMVVKKGNYLGGFIVGFQLII